MIGLNDVRRFLNQTTNNTINDQSIFNTSLYKSSLFCIELRFSLYSI